MGDDEWLDVEAAAEWLGLPKTAIYGLVRHVERSTGPRSPIRFRRAELAEWLEQRRLRPGGLAHLNDYSPTRWRPHGPHVNDVAKFRRAVVDVVIGIDEGEVVSYEWVATEAGYPGRAKAVRDYLANADEDLPWWRVVRSDGCLTSNDIDGQALALRQEGVEVTKRRVRDRSPRRPSADSRGA